MVKTQGQGKRGNSGPGTPNKKSMSYKSGTGSPGVKHKNTKFSQQVDIYETKVDNIVVAICSKPKDAPEASFTHWHQKNLFEQWGTDTLAGQTGIVAALPRKANSSCIASIVGKGTMKQKPNSPYDWSCFVAIKGDDETSIGVGKKIARKLGAFTAKKNELYESPKPDDFMFRSAFTIDPKPLNYHVLDDDTIKVMRLLFSEYTKDELMADEYLMAAFFGDCKTGSKIVGNMGNDDWEDALEE